MLSSISQHVEDIVRRLQKTLFSKFYFMTTFKKNAAVWQELLHHNLYCTQSVLLTPIIYVSVAEQRPADANSGMMNFTLYLLIYRHSLLSWKGPTA